MAEVLLKDIIDTVMLQAEDEDSYLYGVSRNLVISHAKRVLQELNYAGLRSVRLFMSEVSSSGKVYLPEDCVEYVRVFYCVGNYLLPAFLNEHINTTQWDAIKDVEERLILTMTGKRIVTETGKYLSVLSKTNEHVRDYGDVHGMCFLKGYKYNSKENNIVFDYVPCGVTHVAIEYVADPLISEGDVSRLSIHKYFEKAMEEGIYHRIVCKRRNVPMNEKLRAKKEWNVKYKDALNELNAKPEEYFQLLMGWRHMRKGCYPGMGGQAMGASESEAEDFYVCRYEGFVCQREEEEVVIRYEAKYWRYVCQTEEVEDVIEYGADYSDFVCQTVIFEMGDWIIRARVNSRKVGFNIRANNAIVVDWGDGSFEESISTDYNRFKHEYVDNKETHDILFYGGEEDIISFGGNDNKIVAIDLSKNVSLREIYLSNNQLDVLDVSRNVDLELLSCYDNNLTSIDLSKNLKIGTLYIGGNNLTSIDLSKSPNLKIVDIKYNKLKAIDIGRSIYSLDCRYNQLVDLNVLNANRLTIVDCRDNQLVSLDFTNTSVDMIYCDGNPFVNNTNLVLGVIRTLPDRKVLGHETYGKLYISVVPTEEMKKICNSKKWEILP